MMQRPDHYRGPGNGGHYSQDSRANGGNSALDAHHEQQRHIDADIGEPRHLAIIGAGRPERHLAKNQGGMAANDEHPAQADPTNLQCTMQALGGREEGRIGLTVNSPLRTRQRCKIFNQAINDAGLAGPLDSGARAILAPRMGQARDIGYSDEYVENSHACHQKQKEKAANRQQRQRRQEIDHRGLYNVEYPHMSTHLVGHFGGPNTFQVEHSALEFYHSQVPPQSRPVDACSELEARQRAVLEQTLGDARAHIDRRRSNSLPAAHYVPSGILPRGDAAASVQTPPSTQEVLREEAHMRQIQQANETIAVTIVLG
jgi:hypothetical protein